MVVLAGVTAWILAWLTRQLLSRAVHPGNLSQPHGTVRVPVRIVRFVTWVVMTGVLFPPALELFGEKLPAGLSLASLFEWAFGDGLRLCLIALLAFVLIRAVSLTVVRLEHHVASADGPDQVERARRARTLGDLIRNVATVTIISVATLMILQELDLNIMPVLTGAGILGLAVGFGAQTLVKDVISGFFVILENQVRVGDIAEINGVTGTVDAINLRTVLLRDQRGAVHVFPCGSINSLANLTRDFTYAVIDVNVPYQQDMDVALKLMRATGEEMKADPAHGSALLGPLEIISVTPFGETLLTIKARIKVTPARQAEAALELRLRVRRAFTAQGILVR